MIKRIFLLALLVSVGLTGTAEARGISYPAPITLEKTYHCGPYFHGHKVRSYLVLRVISGIRGPVVIWLHVSTLSDNYRGMVTCQK